MKNEMYSFGLPNQARQCSHHSRHLRLALSSISPISLRFHSLSRNVIQFILLSPLFLVPMPLHKKTPDSGTTLYHDVGHGLRKAQQTRKFRVPVVYSNPLRD
jgi:hypothetical protein